MNKNYSLKDSNGIEINRMVLDLDKTSIVDLFPADHTIEELPEFNITPAHLKRPSGHIIRGTTPDPTVAQLQGQLTAIQAKLDKISKKVIATPVSPNL